MKNWSENFSYTIVALFISLILWLTILGRRDFEAIKTVTVEVQTPKEYIIKGEQSRSVEVKIVGNRRGLKEFEESLKNKPIQFEVSRVGYSRVPIRRSDFRLPTGVRLLWIQPDFVEVTVKRVELQQE